MDDLEFFENSTVEDLAAAHEEQLLKISTSEVDNILKLYRQLRRDLQDRLMTMPRGTFTAQQMRGTLYQIDAAINSMSGSLLDSITSAAKEFLGFGADDLLEEINKWDSKFSGAADRPIDLDIVRLVANQENFLFNRHEASLNAYSADLRSQFARELSNAAVAGLSSGEVVQRLSQVFMGEEWKMQRLVRTELHGVYNHGKIAGMQDLVETTVPDLMKTLFHPMDKRTGKDSKRLAAEKDWINGPIIPVDEEFEEKSTGRVVRYMAPPNRPNDRAILIPYRMSWKN